MKNLLLFLFFLCLLGCSYLNIYRPDIQQGNIIDNAQVKRLHIGMNKSEVYAIMGHPVLENVSTKNKVTYVYTFQPRNGKTSKKKVILVFHHNRLAKIDRS